MLMKQQISTDEAPKADDILSQAVVSNGFIFVSGQVHNTTDGVLVDGFADVKFAQIMRNISAILSAAGAELNDIIKVSIYVTDIWQMTKINEVYAGYFTKPYPAREAICVKELPLGATIEVSVVAAK